MEREWFEKRKRLLRTLGYVNLVLFVAFFVFYLVMRSAAIHRAVFSHDSTRQQLRDVLVARWRAEVGFWMTLFTAVVGLACVVKKMKLQDDYNAQILAVDPRLEGDFIPLVK